MSEQLRQYLQLRINGENNSIFQHTLQSLPMSSKLPNALEPQRPALQNDFFTEKNTHNPHKRWNNSSVSGFLSFMRFKIVAFCEGQPEKIWTSLPQRRLHTFTKVKIWKSLRRRFRAESYVQPQMRLVNISSVPTVKGKLELSQGGQLTKSPRSACFHFDGYWKETSVSQQLALRKCKKSFLWELTDRCDDLEYLYTWICLSQTSQFDDIHCYRMNGLTYANFVFIVVLYMFLYKKYIYNYLYIYK